jgi:toxin FitB
VFLVDTNVLSETTRREPSREVLAWLATHPVVALSVVSIAEAIARVAGRLMAEHRKRALAFADVLIAATALSRGYSLATRNVRDFENLGVTVVDPWS